MGCRPRRRDRLVQRFKRSRAAVGRHSTDRSIHLRFVLQVGGVRGELERHHSLRVI